MGIAAGAAWARADAAAAEAITARFAAAHRPILVGLAGAQGSGKSTMAPRLVARLAAMGLRGAVLALDDFYLTRAERIALAGEVHPLLATRGVPGTHDLALLQATLDTLLAGERGEVPVPRFDKAADDREPSSGWDRIAGPADVVLLEGWCVGARPQSEDDLAAPANALERDEDADGRWRRWVNAQLAGGYAALFERLALRIVLRAPDFGVVERWRAEQEATLHAVTGRRGLCDREIRRFIGHYERITRAMIADPPADLVIELDAARTPLT